MNAGNLDGERPFTVVCVFCGDVGQTSESSTVLRARDHFATVHPPVQPVQEGNWDAYESPMRCDTCNVALEPPFYSHVSDPPTTTATVVDGDGYWAACSACHDLWKARDMRGWVQRKVDVASSQSRKVAADPGLQHVIGADAFDLFTRLFTNWDAGVMQSLG